MDVGDCLLLEQVKPLGRFCYGPEHHNGHLPPWKTVWTYDGYSRLCHWRLGRKYAAFLSRLVLFPDLSDDLFFRSGKLSRERSGTKYLRTFFRRGNSFPIANRFHSSQSMSTSNFCPDFPRMRSRVNCPMGAVPISLGGAGLDTRSKTGVQTVERADEPLQ